MPGQNRLNLEGGEVLLGKKGVPLDLEKCLQPGPTNTIFVKSAIFTIFQRWLRKNREFVIDRQFRCSVGRKFSVSFCYLFRIFFWRKLYKKRLCQIMSNALATFMFNNMIVFFCFHIIWGFFVRNSNVVSINLFLFYFLFKFLKLINVV